MGRNSPLVSIIIPLKAVNDYVKENIRATLNGSYKHVEIIVLPDSQSKESFQKTKIVVTGPVGPAEKRDKGARVAKGEILAFIDDDAYPSRDWLKNAVELFGKHDVASVCGPGVTPPHDSVLQKASGAFSASLLGGGPYTFRFIPERARFVDDYPSMNILVRKKDFLAVGGFDTNYWPGEDTKLCHDLVEKKENNILYHPSVLVYHHRRAIFTKHLQQNGRYGLHRGYFARILPKTSFRLSYFIPSLFLLGVVSLPILAVLQRELFYVDAGFFLLYLVLVCVSAVGNLVKEKNVVVSILLIPTTVVTHLFYGAKFLQGFFLTRSLRQ